MRILAFSLPVAALLFNCVLCFVSTRGIHMGKAAVELCELGIVGLAFLMARRQIVDLLPVPMLLIALNLVALMCVSGATDPKIAIDCAIPVGFFFLGRSYADAASARTLFVWLSMLVVGFGMFEMFAFASFEHWFHVFDYFVDKGALSASHAHDTGTSLAENGVRPGDEGRQLFGADFGRGFYRHLRGLGLCHA
jgi:hypothetical protein